MKTALNKARRSLPQAQWIGFREVEERVILRGARDGKLECNTERVSHGVMAEVLVDGQFAYAASPRTDEESLVQAAERAHALAVSARERALFRFTAAQRPPLHAGLQSPSTASRVPTTAEVHELLIAISAKLKRSPEIIRTRAWVETIEQTTRLVCSGGTDAEKRLTLISGEFEATAQKGGVVQRRTSGGLGARSYQGGWEHFEKANLWDEVDRVAEQALELVSAEECPTEVMDLVLSPEQMMLQIHETIGHPLELDRILGDERNYAGWSFVRPEDFGTLQYGSPLMNVTFDPTVSTELASYPFDDNGVQAKREYLIRNGILERALGGVESQARSGIAGVANARASLWNRPPIDRMANLNLEPGTSSRQELLSAVERGVLMESNRSWSVDDFRNKFQFGCEYGKLIENGKISRTVRNPNYRGITVPFWRNLKAVGDRSTFEVFGVNNCGKGEPNQSVRVGHASPLCLFSAVEVFGGAS